MQRTQTNAAITAPSIVRMCLVWLWLLSNLSWAATPLADYQRRVAQAVELAQTSAQHSDLTPAQRAQLQTLKQLLPAHEEVEAAGQIIQVDNQWLHETLAANDADDEAARLAELVDRLAALQQRLAAPTAEHVDETQHAKLNHILAQPEYQQQQKQESVIKQWFDTVKRNLFELLRRLFGGAPRAQPSQRTLNLTRVLIGAALLLALLYALLKLFQRYGRRATPADEATGPREILGEVIGETATTEDLLAAARAHAAQGDYRTAIRRAYIALLFELEQRGKLRLHRAKTNRDYLDALRNEAALYPAFVALTRIFERVWYGHAAATEFDFEGFLNGMRDAEIGIRNPANS